MIITDKLVLLPEQIEAVPEITAAVDADLTVMVPVVDPGRHPPVVVTV